MSFETSFDRPTGIEWNGADRAHGQVKFGDDSQTVVLFYTKAVFNSAKSIASGSRQYENKWWVRIHPPGEKLNIIDREVTDRDKRRYPTQWNAFLQNRTQVPEGTPIDLLFPNNPAVADSLKAFGIHTIQQCSKLSANAMDTVGMGATEWKNMAVAYLENATSGTAFLQLRQKLEQAEQLNRLKDKQISDLVARVNDIENRIKNPNISSAQPGWVPGYDAQADRLNANHPSQEFKKVSNITPPQEELDQVAIIQQVTEENMPTIDVTKDQEEDFAPPLANTRKKDK